MQPEQRLRHKYQPVDARYIRPYAEHLEIDLADLLQRYGATYDRHDPASRANMRAVFAPIVAERARPVSRHLVENISLGYQEIITLDDWDVIWRYSYGPGQGTDDPLAFLRFVSQGSVYFRRGQIAEACEIVGADSVLSVLAVMRDAYAAQRAGRGVDWELPALRELVRDTLRDWLAMDEVRS
jgi:hypothetical protein